MEIFLAEVCTPAWNEEQDRGRSFAEGVAELVARHPDKADLIEAYDKRWLEMVGSAIEGSVAILEELNQRGVPLYSLTNWNGDKFRLTRRRFEFLELFRGILVSGEVGLKKPDPEIFQLLCQRYILDPKDTVFIDDSPKNVDTARRLGFSAIHFQSPACLREGLQGMGLL